VRFARLARIGWSFRAKTARVKRLATGHVAGGGWKWYGGSGAAVGEK
jgi:hypothetical protein